MNSRALLWLPPVFAAFAGGLFALVDIEPTRRSVASTASAAPQPSALDSREPEPKIAVAPRVEAVEPPAPSADAPGPLVSSAPAASADAPGAEPKKLPETREELLAVELRCNREIPEDCETAAQALDTGGVVKRDPERAAMLRRIALTLYVKQCETTRAAACAALADMYDEGRLVKRSAKSAEALRRRVQELCRLKPAQASCDFH